MNITTRKNDAIVILELSGRFDTLTAPIVQKEIDALCKDLPPFVVLNMANVHFVDSTGLSTLVHGMKQYRSLNGNLHLCGLQQPVRIIFELTRLDNYFEIFPVEADAVAAFSA